MTERSPPSVESHRALAGAPGRARLSRMTTWSPALKAWAATLQPMNPAPPVMTVFMWCRRRKLEQVSCGAFCLPVNSIDGDGTILIDGLKVRLIRRLKAGSRLFGTPVEQRDAIVMKEGTHGCVRLARLQDRADVADLLKVIERLAVVADIHRHACPGGEQLPIPR